MIQRSLLRAQRRLPFQTVTTTFTPIAWRLASRIQSNTREASRWYSDAAAAKAQSDSTTSTAKDTTSQANSTAEGNAGMDKLKTELEAKNKEIINLKDQYLRAIADYRNLQDRTKRETQAARDFALQRFGKDLVASIDNLEHALSSVSADKLAKAPPASQENVVETLHTDLVNMHKGLQLTETVLMETLKRHGLVRMDPAEQGEKFDPNIHEALFEAPMPGKTDGTVFVTQQKGFMLNGRVIRAPKVGVVRNS